MTYFNGSRPKNLVVIYVLWNGMCLKLTVHFQEGQPKDGHAIPAWAIIDTLADNQPVVQTDGRRVYHAKGYTVVTSACTTGLAIVTGFVTRD